MVLRPRATGRRPGRGGRERPVHGCRRRVRQREVVAHPRGLIAALADDALPGQRAVATGARDPRHRSDARAREGAGATVPRRIGRPRPRPAARGPASIAGFAELAMNGANGDTVMMIVVDQLEEVFTVCRDEQVPARSSTCSCTGQRPRLPSRVFAAVRSDYYARCTEHAEFAELLGRTNLLVGPMRPDELQRAIEEPARRAGLRARGRPPWPHLRGRRQRARGVASAGDRVAGDMDAPGRLDADHRGVRGVGWRAGRGRAFGRRGLHAHGTVGAGRRARRSSCAWPSPARAPTTCGGERRSRSWSSTTSTRPCWPR